MAQFHPASVEYQRQRWLRPDQERYERPKPYERKHRPISQLEAIDAPGLEEWERHVEAQRIRWNLAALRVQIALIKLAHVRRKAGFNPDQPRVPAGNPDGGQWTGVGGGGAARIQSMQDGRPGPGHNQGPPLDEPPKIPFTQPATAKETNNFLRAAARWVARATRLGGPVGAFITAYQASSWLDTDRAFIESYQDPPKSLEELQAAASTSKWGYHIHHVAERTPAAKEGFSFELIEAPENKVRVPALKHWEITAWYGTKNEALGNVTPRDYLRGKSWDERMRIGREALIKFGVLKP